MKFQVPQFIEMDDKIFGPLSFKEFIYVLGGGGASYIIFRFVPFMFMSLPLIVVVMAFALALAFYKPNNKPFIEMVESALIYFWGHKLYTWKKTNKPIIPKDTDEDFDVSSFSLHTPISTLTETKISSTSRILDMNSDSGTDNSKIIYEKLNIKL